jgi:hypothetical protein
MGTDTAKLPGNTSIIIPRLFCRDPTSEIGSPAGVTA